MIKKFRQRREERKRKRYILENQPSAFDDAVLSWVAPETIRHQRGPVWKVVMGLIVLGLVVWGLFTDAWTFSLAIAVFSVVYYLAELEHPKVVEVKISDIGIKVGGRKYSYSHIKSFWIIYEPPYVRTLNIRVSGKSVSDITIQLDGQNPAAVREFLMGKIPELEGQTEKLSDIFLRLFKI